MGKTLDTIHKNCADKKKQFAVLVDPDNKNHDHYEKVARLAQQNGVDYFFVGGSLLTTDQLDACIIILKDHSEIPVILFPGNTMQMSKKADAILFLSLISGRNPEMLIGRHVIAAPYLKMSGIEVISTGYMLVDSGKPTAVSYMSSSVPIPYDKDDIAACTALAGEMLGLKLNFLDGGSGALQAVSKTMISSVKFLTDTPLIVGGGIRTANHANAAFNAGANIVVVGNAIEQNPELITSITQKRTTV